MKNSIVILPGDGIGPEVINEGITVLKSIEKIYGHEFEATFGLIGGKAFEQEGSALPEKTLKMCKSCDAVLLGCVGEPKWEDPLISNRPEFGYGLIRLRKELGLFANIRPVKLFHSLKDFTNIKPDIVKGIDFLIVRELAGGIYYSEPKRVWKTDEGRKAVDTLIYSEEEIERILRVGFELARSRHKKLTSVDKFQILATSGLWREIANELAEEYPDVKFENMLADACAMRIIQRPADFDVIVTENLFGDILSDEASMLVGSMGMMPSASLSGAPKDKNRRFGLYEPIHGSSPSRTGLDMSNPIATILSVALMLRYSFNLVREADLIEKSVAAVLEDGYRTYDIMGDKMKKIGTNQMGNLISSKMFNIAK